MENYQSGNWGRVVAAPIKREVGLGGSHRVRSKMSRLNRVHPFHLARRPQYVLNSHFGAGSRVGFVESIADAVPSGMGMDGNEIQWE
jgi:hypothetical protein